MGLVENSIVLFLSFILLIRGGIYASRSLSNLASILGVSAFAMSFILMALATTLPELIVAINASIVGDTGLVLGNVIGTNIVNITLILGIVAVVSGRIVLLDYKTFSATRIINIAMIASPLILIIDGVLSRMDGVLLILFFITGAFWLLFIQRKYKLSSVAAKLDGAGNNLIFSFIRHSGVFTLGVALLLFSAYFIVASAKEISLTLGIPEILIGIFVVGIGTSLPELSFGLRSAVRGVGAMSVGNLFGALVLNSTLILGIAAIIRPVRTQAPNVFWMGAAFMVFSVLLAYSFLRTRKFLTRNEGIVLIFVYVLFVAAQVVQNTISIHL